MKIYLIRHGIARDREALPPMSDEQRPLTPKGIRRLEESLGGITQLIPQLDALFSSPLVRATQTAQILARAYTPRPRIQIQAPLVPGGSLAALKRVLLSTPGWAHVALVGHEPQLSNFAANLLTVKKPLMEIKKGGICCIEIHKSERKQDSHIIWYVTPKILRHLRT